MAHLLHPVLQPPSQVQVGQHGMGESGRCGEWVVFVHVMRHDRRGLAGVVGDAAGCADARACVGHEPIAGGDHVG